MAVITLSRQVGSGGDEIALRVSELLGYRYFDKRLVAQVASEMGLTADEIVDFSEDLHEARPQGFLDRLLRRGMVVAEALTVREDAAGLREVTVIELDEAASLRLVQAAVRAACRAGNVVVVGRGGQVILRDEPGVLHVRIEAPLGHRVRRVAEEEHIDEATARDTWVASRDRAGADYVKRFYDVDWSDPMLYHLVINTGRWDIEAAAQLIVDAVGRLPSASA